MTAVENVKAEKRAKREKAEGGEKKARLNPRVVTKVGRALWRAEHLDELKDVSFEDRKVRWGEAKEPYIGRSRKLLRTLRKEGIEFTISKKADMGENDLAVDADDGKDENGASETV